MRTALAFSALALMGCASTVYRIEGEPITPGGPARTACESREFLVLAPTRAEIAKDGSGLSHPEDGLGLYKVGESSPESITSTDGLPQSPILQRKREELAPYDRDQIIAASLGTAGAIAIGIGVALFVSAFESKTSIQADGTRHEDDTVNGSKAAAGGIVVGVGFGLGIAGLVVNPSHAERTRANASRYLFLDPPDHRKDVESLVEHYNSTAHERCEANTAGN